ncbi:hypothetical protein, partial [Frankia sp. Cr1]|uniref:hypothetical protein n=1 Tax=Frankia sp. Cr1 TaxID=3073931 RepID=UPI002AD5AED0
MIEDRGVPTPEIVKKLTIKTGKNAATHPRSRPCTGHWPTTPPLSNRPAASESLYPGTLRAEELA